MRTPPPRPGAALRRADTTDGGFTLIEVMVAFTLFLTFSTAVLSVLGAGIKLGNEDSSRLTATNLASRELEVTRDVFSSPTQGPNRLSIGRFDNPSPLSSGTVGQPLVVNNVPYTVTRTTQWASVAGSAASTCDDGTGTELAYLKVRVDVSWPTLGSRPPVTMYTTMTPRKGTYAAGAAHIGLKVVDRSGRPLSGITATASGPSPKTGATGADGCVLLPFLTPGTYQITLSSPGYVNQAGDTTAAQTITIGAGELSRSTIEYDRAATINATFVTDPGFGLPTGLSSIPVTLANSALRPVGTRIVSGSGNPRALTNLYPFPSGYQIFAGSCADNDPEFAGNGAPPAPTGPVRYEAEIGKARGGAQVDSSGGGYSGTGYVTRLDSSNARVEELFVDRINAGTVTVTVAYSAYVFGGGSASGGFGNRTLRVSVNGTPLGLASFSPSFFQTYRTTTFDVPMRAGTNEISFAVLDGASGNVDLDYLEIVPEPVPPAPVGARLGPIPTEPGGTAAGNVRLAGFTARGIPGQTVRARQDGCAGSGTVVLGTIGSDGTLRTSLPYGTWQLWTTSQALSSTVVLNAPATGGTVTPPTVVVA